MNYCKYCGNKLNNNPNFCNKCGNALKNISQNNKNPTNKSDSTAFICGIVGLCFPIIGAILYYIYKDSNISAARAANICSWIGFLIPLIFILFYNEKFVLIFF